MPVPIDVSGRFAESPPDLSHEEDPVPDTAAGSEASAGTPTRRGLGFAGTFVLSPDAPSVDDQGEKIKELEKKVEDRDKKLEELQKTLGDFISQFASAKVKADEENAMLKQAVEDLKGTIDEVKKANVGSRTYGLSNAISRHSIPLSWRTGPINGPATARSRWRLGQGKRISSTPSSGV